MALGGHNAVLLFGTHVGEGIRGDQLVIDTFCIQDGKIDDDGPPKTEGNWQW